MSRRARLIAVAGVLAAILAAYLAGPGAFEGRPYDPASTGPSGTRALLDVLTSTGSQVDISLDRPPADVSAVLVLVDGLSTQRREALREWTGRGGRLVVTDPASPLLDVEPSGGLTAAVVGPVAFTPDCDLLPEVGPVLAGDWTTFDPAAADDACFRIGDGAWLVSYAFGDGEVVALGGADGLTNRRLADGQDNAVLGVHLLAPRPGTHVQVVPLPTPGGGDATLPDLVPRRVLHLLGGLAGLFLLVAWWRGRRLGPPVDETLPLRVPGAALIRGMGDLLQRAGDRDGAARGLRRELRRDLGIVLGLGPDAPAEVLADRVAERTDLGRDQVLATLRDRPVPDDGALLSLGREAALVRQRVRSRTGAPS